MVRMGKIVQAPLIGVLFLVLTGCASNPIEAYNLGKNASNLSRAGVTEEVLNCVSDYFDPFNRGSGCN